MLTPKEDAQGLPNSIWLLEATLTLYKHHPKVTESHRIYWREEQQAQKALTDYFYAL